MTVTFPRAPDAEGWAWGLDGPSPIQVWERHSPRYEAQAERIVRALEARGLVVCLAGAGSQDGEYVLVRNGVGGLRFFAHLEDPAVAERFEAADDAQLSDWIAAFVAEIRTGAGGPDPQGGSDQGVPGTGCGGPGRIDPAPAQV